MSIHMHLYEIKKNPRKSKKDFLHNFYYVKIGRINFLSDLKKKLIKNKKFLINTRELTIFFIDACEFILFFFVKI